MLKELTLSFDPLERKSRRRSRRSELRLPSPMSRLILQIHSTSRAKPTKARTVVRMLFSSQLTKPSIPAGSASTRASESFKSSEVADPDPGGAGDEGGDEGGGGECGGCGGGGDEGDGDGGRAGDGEGGGGKGGGGEGEGGGGDGVGGEGGGGVGEGGLGGG